MLSLLVAGPAAGGDDNIAALSAKIAQEPTNGILLLRRAALNSNAGDVDAALADLELAATLPGGGPEADRRAAWIMLDAERFAPALEKFTRALTAHPDDLDGRRGQARALWHLGRAGEATKILRALQAAPTAAPEMFQDHADLLMRGPTPRLGKAIAVLDAGIRRFGPLPDLIMNVVALERRARRWSAALAHVDLALANSPRRDHWLGLRGAILAEAGRPGEAAAAFEAATVALAALPQEVRQRPDLVRAAAQLDAQLKLNHAAAVPARARPARRAQRPGRPAAAAPAR